MSSSSVGPDIAKLSAVIQHSVSPHTWSDYSAAWNRWLVFCRSLDFDCYQHSEGAVLSFLCILMHDNLSHGHISKILAGVSFFFKLHNLPPLNVFFSVKQALKGYRKSTFVQDKRRPVSFELLRRICVSTNYTCLDQFESGLFTAAFCIAFFAALRVSELVPTTKSGTSGLLFQDVIVSNEGTSLFIRHSKTDQLGKGCCIQLYPCGDQIICPVLVLQRYLAIRPPFAGNFFCHKDGSPLTKYQFS